MSPCANTPPSFATFVFLYDRATGVTIRVSLSSEGQQADGPSFGPALSADGHHVAFDSKAPNLVPGDTNEGSDVFVRTRAGSG